MFGPNSAGKSSVEEGVRLLSEIICDSEDRLDGEEWGAFWGLDNQTRRTRLMRNWRRTSEKAESYVDFMQIGASAWIEDQDRLLEDLFTSESAGCYQPSPGSHRLEVIVRFRNSYKDRIPDAALPRTLLDIFFLLDDIPFLEFSENAEAALNFTHPILSFYPVPEACKFGERRDGRVVLTEGGWLRMRGGMHVDERKQLDQRYFVLDWIYGGEEDGTPPLEIIDALRWFADIFDKVLANGCRVMGGALKPYLVPASRSTPEARHLSFLVAGSKKGNDDEHDAFRMIMNGDSRYRHLASSFANGIWQERQAVPPDDGMPEMFIESYDQRVNRMLCDHLFIETGYQLKANHLFLMNQEQLESCQFLEKSVMRGTGEECSLLITIYLMDSNGRQLRFTEVGSGLGYILPVLAAVCDYSLSTVVVQQPELHLHPALQAALGDVFVELSHGNRRLIIETHSEHLLLRVLKRLRQSRDIQGGNPELYIVPDDVAILYFDPQRNGTTKVNLLRVSADGEFLDRWPRGFFTERDEELFDE